MSDDGFAVVTAALSAFGGRLASRAEILDESGQNVGTLELGPAMFGTAATEFAAAAKTSADRMCGLMGSSATAVRNAAAGTKQTAAEYEAMDQRNADMFGGVYNDETDPSGPTRVPGGIGPSGSGAWRDGPMPVTGPQRSGGPWDDSGRPVITPLPAMVDLPAGLGGGPGAPKLPRPIVRPTTDGPGATRPAGVDPSMPGGRPAMPAMPAIPKMPQGDPARTPAMPTMPQGGLARTPAVPPMPTVPQGGLARTPAVPPMPTMPQGGLARTPAMPPVPAMPRPPGSGMPVTPSSPAMPRLPGAGEGQPVRVPMGEVPRTPGGTSGMPPGGIPRAPEVPSSGTPRVSEAAAVPLSGGGSAAMPHPGGGGGFGPGNGPAGAPMATGAAPVTGPPPAGSAAGATARPGAGGMAMPPMGGSAAGGGQGGEKERKSAGYIKGEEVFAAPDGNPPPPVIGAQPPEKRR
ncbi:hypothetical protein [Actinocrispum wychmicini]|uniref:Excreted virulence factor EspC (Type VII ESX diderm) n=1 Tax=Actinocrispum wychmicini TaxID=1213861 RepID=A0A4R2JB24_9PSEU|nr:hypothetical protein [Actinocrispum wychmicini]TCO56014.1 hypothetical protein EV192_107439 [Actinocrispum wychmicini]